MKKIAIILSALCLWGCGSNNSDESLSSLTQDSLVVDTPTEEERYEVPQYLNSVKAHDERKMIVGNFTGHSIDTLYVIERNDLEFYREEDAEYLVKCSNPEVPSFKMYGHCHYPCRLVYEGDLDSNGTDEVGYLMTWTSSAWRRYLILSLVDGEWRFLKDPTGECLFTHMSFRAMGIEIAEPGEKQGTIKINYWLNSPVSPEPLDTVITPVWKKYE